MSGANDNTAADRKEKVLFCQVDANLDSNPKIVKAGGFGAAVFAFILRRVKVLGTDGWVPTSNVDPEYLEQQLRFPASDMASGVSAAVRAGLLDVRRDTGHVLVVGWTEEWDGMRRTKKTPSSLSDDELAERRHKEAARKREQRKKLKGSESNDPVPSASGDVPGGTNDVQQDVPRPACPDDKRGEEKRGEEREERETRARERHPDAGAIANAVWQHANAKSNELRAANVNVHPWPLMASGQHSGWQILLDRVGELLAGSTADEAKRRALNRVDVAAAKARNDGDGSYFKPTVMFTRKSFDAFVDDDPKNYERKKSASAPADVIPTRLM